MGIYDRDYERGYDSGGWRPEGSAGGLQLRWPTTAVGWVLLVTIAVYLIELLFREELGIDPRTGRTVYANDFIDVFLLNSQWYLQPWRCYSLLTYGFLHDQGGIMHIAFNMWGFWLFGRELERRLGTREFLLFYLVAVVFAGLAFTLAGLLEGGAGYVLGASGGTVAVTILFALLYPQQRVLLMMVFPVPMWALGVFIVGNDVFGALGRPGSNVAFTAHLGGAAFALLYHYRRVRLSEWVPDRLALPSLKRRPKLRVHHGDTSMYDEPDEPDPMEDQLDRVLAKIQSQGQDSLTRQERRILEQASRRYQRRKP